MYIFSVSTLTCMCSRIDILLGLSSPLDDELFKISLRHHSLNSSFVLGSLLYSHAMPVPPPFRLWALHCLSPSTCTQSLKIGLPVVSPLLTCC